MGMIKGLLDGLVLLGGALSGEETMTASEIEEKYKNYKYSYMYVGGEDLIKRLEEMLQYQYDVEAEAALNDAIVYVRNHYFYY